MLLFLLFDVTAKDEQFGDVDLQLVKVERDLSFLLGTVVFLVTETGLLDPLRRAVVEYVGNAVVSSSSLSSSMHVVLYFRSAAPLLLFVFGLRKSLVSIKKDLNVTCRRSDSL